MTEVRQRSESGGEKGKKPQQMSHIPIKFLQKLSEVYSHAQETKYKDVAPGTPNWSQGYPWSLSYDAMMRHLMAFWRGEYNDPDDGLPHLCHAAWHCATLYTWFEEGIHPEYDDRPTYYRKQIEPTYECCGQTFGSYANWQHHWPACEKLKALEQSRLADLGMYVAGDSSEAT